LYKKSGYVASNFMHSTPLKSQDHVLCYSITADSISIPKKVKPAQSFYTDLYYLWVTFWMKKILSDRNKKYHYDELFL